MESSKTVAIRCEHDGLKMAEVKAGCLILRQRHHGEMHVQIVPLGELVEYDGKETDSLQSARGGHD